jgi:hypothetical protein
MQATPYITTRDHYKLRRAPPEAFKQSQQNTLILAAQQTGFGPIWFRLLSGWAHSITIRLGCIFLPDGSLIIFMVLMLLWPNLHGLVFWSHRCLLRQSRLHIRHELVVI